jgi:hypothetical protein
LLAMVTGVQTCALPISRRPYACSSHSRRTRRLAGIEVSRNMSHGLPDAPLDPPEDIACPLCDGEIRDCELCRGTGGVSRKDIEKYWRETNAEV